MRPWLLPRLARRFGGLLLIAATAAAASGQIPADSPIADALRRADQAIAALVSVADAQRNFENTVLALDDALGRLEKETSFTQFLAYVSPSREEREAGRVAEEHFNNWRIDLLSREDVFRALRAFADSGPQLEGERARALEDMLRDFRRAGMALTPEQRARLTELNKEITRVGIEFDANIRADETRVPLTRAELAGLSDEDVANYERSGDIYLVDMSYPSFNPIMDYCDNETTREKVWLAYKRRGGKKNVATLERLLKLRAAAAELLGYPSTADFEIEAQMAKTPATVRAFYEKLRPLVRQKAERDFAELLAAKRAHTNDAAATLRPWDTQFYLDRLKKTKYAVDSKKAQEYFPLQRVMEGLFNITQSLYGLKYRDTTAEQSSHDPRPLWHPDVRRYEVLDVASGARIGEFYIDLFPRPEDEKYGHAAQWSLVMRKRWADGGVEQPVAALVCNFTKPTPEKPSLLTHDEVETLFHEFGHCLHTLLSEAELWRFAGPNCARDFVEAPSQMFENWVWDAQTLKSFTGHYHTGEPLPDDLLAGMLRARRLGSGMAAERQFYFGLIDLTYHSASRGEIDTTQAALDLDRQVELYDPPPGTFFQASFGHLNGYQAGYYGYQWSLVYACDMFQRFKELGLLDPEAGMYYRKRILARGGSMDEMALVRDYLGREPDMTAYLKHLGLDE